MWEWNREQNESNWSVEWQRDPGEPFSMAISNQPNVFSVRLIYLLCVCTISVQSICSWIGSSSVFCHSAMCRSVHNSFRPEYIFSRMTHATSRLCHSTTTSHSAMHFGICELNVYKANGFQCSTHYTRHSLQMQFEVRIKCTFVDL